MVKKEVAEEVVPGEVAEEAIEESSGEVSEVVEEVADLDLDKVEKEDEEEGNKVTDVPGIGPGIAAKLEAAGVYDLMGLAVMSPPSLSDMAGIGEAVARKAIQAARGMMKLGFVDGTEFAKNRENVHYVSTGSQNLNDLLGGKGIESKAMTEFYGGFGSGKTQCVMTLAVNTQLSKDQGGAGGKVVIIDTEGTFRPDRIRQIAEGIGANPEKVLKNILVARAFNSDHQILLIDRIGEMIKDGEPVKMVIVDSLTAHFRAEFAGRGQLADRQQKLNRYLHNLMKMAEQHNLSIVVTNQVMANPAMMFGDPTTAVGGHIVGHMSTYRIYLRRGKQGSRVAKLIDSPNLPDNECQFYITEHGVRDDG